ncbi:MAG TPA: S1/P1 nuclease [Pirellulales bacterium]
MIVVVLALTSPAWAWNAAGHMVTGAIAYSTLKASNPDALDKIVAILKQHPEFDQRWARPLSEVTDDEQGLNLFMLAARWPDDIRREREFTHPKWHYINLPFKPAGQPDSVQPPELDPENIRVGFRQNVGVLQSDASDAEKAVALCWVLHLVGDAHQPLHTATLYTTEFPEGDRGGTHFFIRAREGSRPIGLHTIWDDFMLGSSKFRRVHNKAIELRAEYPRDQLQELEPAPTAVNFEAWLQESFETARMVAYDNGQLAGSPDKADAPVLPDGYLAEGKRVACRRGALAGNRMAGVLASVFRDAGASGQQRP